jgi:hypothetical protein
MQYLKQTFANRASKDDALRIVRAAFLEHHPPWRLLDGP